MKPQLVDYSIFKKNVDKPVIKNVVKKNINISKNNDIGFLFNIMLVILLGVGVFFLYKRNKEKNINKDKYKKKVENLYNTINKYNG